MKTNTPRRASAVLAGLSILGAAACGGAPKPRAHTTPTPAAEDITAKPGAEILTLARNALANASSVHLKGRMTTDDGVLTMNLQIGQGKSAGTMTMPVKRKRVALQIRSVQGKLYLRSPQLLRAMGGDLVARAVGDRWFSKQIKEFEPFTDLTKFSAFATADGEVTKGGTEVVNGHPALLLKEDGDRMFVATDGKPYPLRVSKATGDDHLDFLDYGVPFTVEVPANAVDADHGVSA